MAISNRLLLSLAALVLALTTSCSRDTASPATTISVPATSSESTSPVAQEPVAETTVEPVALPYELPHELDFTATLFDGGAFIGADLARQDVLFWFWAPM